MQTFALSLKEVTDHFDSLFEHWLDFIFLINKDVVCANYLHDPGPPPPPPGTT
jgi:hypothetical protein